MLNAAVQAPVYFWGEDVVEMGVREQLERLRVGASLAMAVAPEAAVALGEELGRGGWVVRNEGRALCISRR